MNGLTSFFAENGATILQKSWEHIQISMIALLLGICIAVPLGIILTRYRNISGPIMSIAGVLQTIPSLALLALMIPLFGVGRVPAIVALFIYSLLPILRNTFVGMTSVDPVMKDAAKGMGMTNLQSIFKIECPAAMPAIMGGIRLSAVYVIAWTTLASYIGAGGLGDLIFSGLNLYKLNLIVAGTIPVSCLAIAVDFLLARIERGLTPLPYRGGQHEV